MPPELPLLVELLHAGLLIVDDIEDDAIERRGAPAIHRLHGVPTALDAGNWLDFLPFTLIDSIPVSPATQLAIDRRFSATLLRCHQGQALDLTARAWEVDCRDVRSIVEATISAKTGALMELSAHLGALVAGATGAPLRAITQFGTSPVWRCSGSTIWAPSARAIVAPRGSRTWRRAIRESNQ